MEPSTRFSTSHSRAWPASEYTKSWSNNGLDIMMTSPLTVMKEDAFTAWTAAGIIRWLEGHYRKYPSVSHARRFSLTKQRSLMHDELLVGFTTAC
jgi:hypothetical protein